MSGGNVRFFIVFALFLGIAVVAFEVYGLLFGPKVSDDLQFEQSLVTLPDSFDTDLITRIDDREKYLLYNQEQFLGLQITVTPTPTPSVTVKPTPSVTVKPSGSVTPTPTTTH